MSAELPETMTAVEITEDGGPDVLKPATRPVPEAGAGEVLIKVAAAGGHRPDMVPRQGLDPATPGAADIPGLEVAGTIAAIGADAGGWAIGDEVTALVTGGGYAEYCAAPAPQCLAVPQGLSLVEAAALPETFFTVWSNVFDRAGLSAGEIFLVHGGSSGIGTTAIQLAKAQGARVLITAASDANCAACRDPGAHRARTSRRPAFHQRFTAPTGGRRPARAHVEGSAARRPGARTSTS